MFFLRSFVLVMLLWQMILFPGPVRGQGVLKVSLVSAVDSAMHNNTLILRYRQTVAEKEQMRKASAGNFFPSVDMMGGYSWISQNPEVNMSKMKESVDQMFGYYGAHIAQELGLSDEAQEVIYQRIVDRMSQLPAYNIAIDQQHYPNLNIVATQPLFLGGKIIAGRRFAEAELGYSNAELQKVSNEVTRETIERYFGVVLLQQVVAVRRQVVAGMQRHEREAQRAIDIGVIPSHELLRAKVAVANAERDMIDDQNKLELVLLALKASMGLPDTVTVEVTDSLFFRMIPLEVAGLKKEAVAQQPVFHMIDQQKIMVRQKHALIRSEFMPQIAAWGQYNAFGNNYPVTLPPFIIGVQAHFNIFHGLEKYNKLKATRYLSDQVELADKYAHEQINLLVDKSWREVINKRERYLKMEPTVALARKNLEINEKRFREGLSRSTDVIDARLLYEGAEVERLKSLYDYFLAIANLYLATGDTRKAIEMLDLSSK